MDSFEVIINALGNYAKSCIPDVRLIRIYPDEADRTAHLEICLKDESWASKAAAIAAMPEVRSMYMDELSISYEFDTVSEEELSEAAWEKSQTFAVQSH